MERHEVKNSDLDFKYHEIQHLVQDIIKEEKPLYYPEKCRIVKINFYI